MSINRLSRWLIHTLGDTGRSISRLFNWIHHCVLLLRFFRRPMYPHIRLLGRDFGKGWHCSQQGEAGDDGDGGEGNPAEGEAQTVGGVGVPNSARSLVPLSCSSLTATNSVFSGNGRNWVC
ncbi:hypothetical protein KC19_VG282200 [Ceratodon purpureus]|uniref:Uncharacterized protein n=1 Tax=Ceratodon purpureus TaxID=3225 RepID=A0A8T0HW03_CERPU|nr:hypothetical protein KC19_VG282200 [Ceratodon purpureus]